MLKRLILLILFIPALVFADSFVEGKDYQLLVDAKTNQQASITEFFSYGCPWCNRLEPGLASWLKNANHSAVKFTRIPVIFHKDWVYYAKAYYAAELLGLSEKFTPLLFKAIQVDNLLLNSNQAMIEFFVEHGVDKATAESAFEHSTIVDMKITEGSQSMARYQINGVPAFIVNHRFKTDIQMAGSEERLFKILDYLITKTK